jgi:hypothetical protein
MTGTNVLLRAAGQSKRSRRRRGRHVKAAPVEKCTCMGRLPDGHAKCCQIDALARQLPAPSSMQSGAGRRGSDSAWHQWRQVPKEAWGDGWACEHGGQLARGHVLDGEFFFS